MGWMINGMAWKNCSSKLRLDKSCISGMCSLSAESLLWSPLTEGAPASSMNRLAVCSWWTRRSEFWNWEEKETDGLVQKTCESADTKIFLGILVPYHGYWSPGVLCNIGYPSETRLKRKSREISFVHDIRFNCPIGLKFCIEHGSDTAVLCAKFQSDQSIEAWVMDKRDFTRFEFKMNFGRISYIAQGPWLLASPSHQQPCF